MVIILHACVTKGRFSCVILSSVVIIFGIFVTFRDSNHLSEDTGMVRRNYSILVKRAKIPMLKFTSGTEFLKITVKLINAVSIAAS